MIRFFFVVVVSLSVLLAGCGSYGDPGPIGRFGYQQQRLGDDVIRVRYAGPPSMDEEMRRDYLLYGAAQAALKRGAPYFQIMGEAIVRGAPSTGSPIPEPGAGTVAVTNRAGGEATFPGSPERQAVSEVRVRRSGVPAEIGSAGPSGEVLIRISEKPEDDSSFVTRQVIRELEAKYPR